ncbi:MAG: MMPL family transporter, partial [Myxococcota bacterium]|nr:MMPL family transporter [Myxococcota bacterium]
MKWGVRTVVGVIVDASGRRPVAVLLLALCALATTWFFAVRVLAHPHTDLRELLPSDSAALKAFEHQLGRVGGGATLIVVTESPERVQNERFVDDLGARLAALNGDRTKNGGAPLIAYVESGTKDVHAFFEANKWLYADQQDLENAEQTLDRQVALGSGMVEDLEDHGAAQGSADADRKKPALGLDEYRDRWKAAARARDDFPTGYFETVDGRMAGIRIVSSTTGMGDAGGDALLAQVERVVAEMNAASYHPAMKIGFAGDIPNAAAEKESIVSQAAWASAAALLVILTGVIWFYRSPWSLPIITLPALLGVGSAYAFAYFRFGYVNTTGMFLGAIILGNGINYPIVLLSRYREFRARGQAAEDARRE